MKTRYTAQDMREMADDFENYADLDESDITEMLRQGADAIEQRDKLLSVAKAARKAVAECFRHGCLAPGADAEKVACAHHGVDCNSRDVCRALVEAGFSEDSTGMDSTIVDRICLTNRKDSRNGKRKA